MVCSQLNETHMYRGRPIIADLSMPGIFCYLLPVPAITETACSLQDSISKREQSSIVGVTRMAVYLEMCLPYLCETGANKPWPRFELFWSFRSCCWVYIILRHVESFLQGFVHSNVFRLMQMRRVEKIMKFNQDTRTALSAMLHTVWIGLHAAILLLSNN